MYLGPEESRRLRAICIEVWRGKLPPHEATVLAKKELARVQHLLAEAQERVDSVMPHLRERTITVNEAEKEILLGE